MHDAQFRFAGLFAFRWRLVAAALVLATASAGAQTTATITGRVITENGQPLAGAQVRLVNMTLGTLTGDNGRYTLGNLPVAQYRIRAQMLGHRPVELPVTLVAGQTVTQDFTLRKQVLELDAVVVTGTAGAARQREVGNAVAQIDMAKVQEPPQNVGQLLQGRAPGMTVMTSSAGSGSGSMIRLRGNVSVAMIFAFRGGGLVLRFFLCEEFEVRHIDHAIIGDFAEQYDFGFLTRPEILRHAFVRLLGRAVEFEHFCGDGFFMVRAE